MSSPRPSTGWRRPSPRRRCRCCGPAVWRCGPTWCWSDGPAQTQAHLAAAVGRDRTRLIPILDRLQTRGLLHRTPDPADRRNNVVRLSAAGRELLDTCRADIRALEDQELAHLDGPARESFRATLDQLVQRFTGG